MQVISQAIHSVLLVIMFIAQDITTKPKNNKPENLVWFFKHLFGQRYLRISWYESIVLIVYYDVFVHRLAEKALFSIEHYETWKPRRKLYDPAFNKRSLIFQFLK